MITAIPMKQDRVSNHFTKADSFIFIDELGQIKRHKANPALNTNCSGKSGLIDMLLEENAQRIVVRNIGERILSKLIDNNFLVYQTNCGHQATKELASAQPDNLIALTTPSQGRKSRNHEAKKANGGCNHTDHSDDSKNEKCGNRHGNRGQSKGRCCD